MGAPQAVYTVQIKRLSLGAKDAHGNAVETWGDPEDFEVYSVAPRASSEPREGGSAVVSGLALYAPESTPPGPRDVVLIDASLSPAWAGEWEVEGEIADYTKGPFGFRAGLVVNLKRAEG